MRGGTGDLFGDTGREERNRWGAGEGLQATWDLLLKKTHDTDVYTQACVHAHSHTHTPLKTGHMTRFSTGLHNNVAIWESGLFSC